LRGHHETFKLNIKNPIFQILVNNPKILHSENEEEPLKNKKIAQSDVLAKLGERKNSGHSQDQIMYAIFMHMCI
jgi:hypothetical protein